MDRICIDLVSGTLPPIQTFYSIHHLHFVPPILKLHLVVIFICSVSTALDEAATALTRMKSEKQTYEAFLRGANQAPSPVSVSASSHPQPQPSYPAISSVAVATSIPGAGSKGGGVAGGGGGGAGGGRTPSQQKGPPQQQQQQQPSQQNQQSTADSMQTVQRLLTQGVCAHC